MRKVTKILGMIGSAMILLLILLPIMLSIALSLPAIQNRVVGRATRLASEFLGSEVSIGAINVSMRGGLELYDVLICDLQQDTMIYASRLESEIQRVPILGRRVVLGNTTIQGGEVNLLSRVNDEGEVEMNIRQITQLLTPKTRSANPVTVDVANIVLSGVTVRIKQLTPLDPEFGVDMRDLEIGNISASLSNLMVDGPTLHTYVNRLSAEEKSGFDIDNFSGELYITEGALALLNMSLYSRWSSLEIDHLMLTNENWRNYREFNKTTTINIDITSGNIASDDLAYFAPGVRNWGVEFRDIEFTASGEVADLNLEIMNISYGEDTDLTAGLNIVGLPNIDQSHFNITLDHLATSALDLDQLKWALTNSGFDEATHSKLEALGSITLRGEVVGDLRSLSLDGSMQSDSGGLEVDMAVERDEGGVTLDGWVEISDVAMAKILPESGLDDLSMRVDVDGRVAGIESHIAINSQIERVKWRDRHIEALQIAGAMSRRGVDTLTIICQDPTIEFELRGAAPLLFDEAKRPSYNLDLDLRSIDLKALGLNMRDSTSRLTLRATLSGEGRNVEECWGDATIYEGEYLHNSDTITLSQIDATLHSREGSRLINIKSDYAEVNFTSSSRIKDISEYAQGVMARYLPALYDNPHVAQIESEGGESESRLSIEFYNINPIAKAISTDLEVGDGSRIDLTFDPYDNQFEARLNAPFFEHGTTLAIDLNGQICGNADSLVINSTIRELLVGTSLIERSMLRGSAIDNRVELRATFENPTDSAYADIGANLLIGRDSRGDREMNMVVSPSTFTRRNEAWSMRSRDIKISKLGFDIDNFMMESRNQRMTINGRASTSPDDTLRMRLHNFDLSIFSSLIAQLGYQIEGRTNGEAVVSSVLRSRRIEANVELDSVSVNTLAAPAMLLKAEWDSNRNRARLHLTERVSRDTLIRGYYIPSEVKYYAQLDVDSLHMAMLDPPLGGVITDTEGNAKLSLTLQGVRREAHLNGTITANNFSTTVDYTKVRYNAPQAIINVKDNILEAPSIKIFDKAGNRGDLSLRVDLQHLSNIEYLLNIKPNRLMVLDTKEVDNDLFYGSIFASGEASIEGNKSGVRMDIAARTESNSAFFMPLANKANISTVDFITFVQPIKIDTTDMMQRRIMQLQRRGRERGNANMTINMALNVRPNTELQLVIDPTVGDIIRAKGEGQMNLQIEPQANIFDIYGDYTISEGNYLFTLRNIVNKRFVIDPGSMIQWTGQAMDPILDINAIYQLKTSLQPLISDESTRAVPVNCVISLSDRLNQPDVSFSIELPSADPEQQSVINSLLNDQESISRQFFYLMLANSFISDSTTGGTSDLGVSTTTATGFELLTNQLSNWLSSSNYNIVIRYRPESELTGDEVDFGFSRGLIDNRLLVELEGNYIIDNKQALTEDSSNFMGDAYITWLIDQAGALRLKGFTQTIDRYDENQGLQETGIGIYYRENFDNFRDLQQRVRARFKASDERLERREERRTTRKQGDDPPLEATKEEE